MEQQKVQDEIHVNPMSNVIEENDNLQNEVKRQEQEMAMLENHHNQRQEQEISSLRHTSQGQDQEISSLRLINLQYVQTRTNSQRIVEIMPLSGKRWYRQLNVNCFDILNHSVVGAGSFRL